MSNEVVAKYKELLDNPKVFEDPALLETYDSLLTELSRLLVSEDQEGLNFTRSLIDIHLSSVFANTANYRPMVRAHFASLLGLMDHMDLIEFKAIFSNVFNMGIVYGKAHAYPSVTQMIDDLDKEF